MLRQRGGLGVHISAYKRLLVSARLSGFYRRSLADHLHLNFMCSGLKDSWGNMNVRIGYSLFLFRHTFVLISCCAADSSVQQLQLT